jgi:hypothetical protein
MRALTMGLVLGCVVVVATTACTERRVGLSKDQLVRDYDRAKAEPLPSAAELLALRWPQPPPAPDAVDGAAAEVAFARGADVAAIADDAVACLAADVDRRYDDVVTRCVAALGRAPGDARAPAIVRVLARHVGSLRDEQRSQIAAALQAAVSSCATAKSVLSCADLAVVVDDARRAAVVDAAGLAAVKAESIWARVAVAEGPFLYGDESFSTSPFARLPLEKHLQHRVKDLREREEGSGVLSAADGDVEGWWRTSLYGKSDAVDVTVVVKAGSAVEVRVDDVPVAVRPRGARVESFIRVPLRLNAGLHHIEVMGYDSGGGVKVAVLDRLGKPALTAQPHKRWGKEAGAVARVDDGAFAALVLPPRLDPGNASTLVTLAFKHVLARASYGVDVDVERGLAQQLLRAYGWSLPGLVLATQTLEDDVLPERVAGALAATLWDRVTVLRPNHPLPLLARARRAADEDPEGELAARRAVVAARPDYPVGHRELIDALLARDVVDEAVVAADALLALGETDENIEAAVPALRAAGQMTRALRLVEASSTRAGKADALHRQRLQRGDVDAARDEAKRRHARGDRTGTERYLDLIDIVDPVAALAVVDEALAARPFDRALLDRRARLAYLAASTSTAATSTAVPPAPTRADLDAWQWRESAGGDTPWSDRYARGDDVIRQRRASAEPYAGFGTVFLLDDVERRFFADASSVVVRHWVAELRTKDALDAFGELRVDDDERLLRLRLVKADGTVLLPERHANVDDVSLPGLAPGDIVEWLSVRADRPLTGAYWETRSLQTSTPAVARTSVFRMPRALADTWGVRAGSRALIADNGAPAAVIAEAPSGTDAGVDVVVTFRMAGEPILDEPQSVERDETEPLVGVALGVAIDDDAARAAFWRRQRVDEFASRTRRDAWLELCAAQVAGRGDNAARFGRVFRFVAEQVVAADGPADAQNVLAAGTGQRLPLFVALVRSLGLPVRVLAVQSPLVAPGPTPHRSSYGSVVVVVDVDGVDRYVWLDGDAATVDALPPALKGGQALDLETGAASAIPDAAIDAGRVVVDVDVAKGDGGLVGYVALRLPTGVAEAVRPGLRRATPEQLVRLLEGALAASLPGVTVSAPTLPGIDAVGTPLALVADVVVPAVAGADGVVRLEHLFAQGAAAAFSVGPPLSALSRVAERKRPLRVFPEAETLRLQLRLPATASFVEVPEAATLSAGPVTLRQVATVDDGVLYFERDLTRLGARVAVADWPGVRAAVATLLTRADARVAFLVPTGSRKPDAPEQTR